MSETLTVLKTRRSCRAYKPELIEEEIVRQRISSGEYVEVEE